MDGAVRLDVSSFERLVTRADEAPGELLDVPGMAEALAAVREPLVQVQADVASRQRRQVHRGWARPDVVALLVAVDDTEHQLLALPPSMLAAGLARVLRLGPPRTAWSEPADERVVDAEILEDLFHDDDMRRLSAFAELGADLAWSVAVSWDGGDRRLAVVETAQARWGVVPEQDGWQLVPTTATRLWRQLTTLLPDEQEMPRG